SPSSTPKRAVKPRPADAASSVPVSRSSPVAGAAATPAPTATAARAGAGSTRERFHAGRATPPAASSLQDRPTKHSPERRGRGSAEQHDCCGKVHEHREAERAALSKRAVSRVLRRASPTVFGSSRPRLDAKPPFVEE